MGVKMNFDFGEVLSRSWQITWKHKVLWLYGSLQTMAGFLLLPLAIIPAFAPLISDQAGGITNEPWFFLIFFGGFFIFMLELYPLSVVINGALTMGVLRAEQGEEKLSFMELIRESLPYFGRLLGSMLLFGGGILLVMLIFFALQTILSVVTLGLGTVCTGPISLLSYPLFFVWYVCLEQSMTAIVVDKMNVMDAARQSWELFRKNMAAVVVIGLVLYFGLSLIGGIIMLPMIVPFFAIPFALGVEEFNRMILLVAGICAAIYLPLFVIFQGAVMAFMKSGWVLTYLRLTRSPTLQPLLQEATS
jgi:hypothetical protein